MRWSALVACVLAAFALLAYPVYVIRPFRYQGTRELQAALFVTRHRPTAEVLLAILAVVLAVAIWRSSTRLISKIGGVACAVLAIAFASLCRVNIYELMFHPLDKINIVDASKSRLDGDEEVITVRMNNSARAYPIRVMSYHHIVNDVLGREPIVATY